MEKIRVRDLQGNEFDLVGPPEYIKRIQNDQEFADEQIQIQSDKRFAYNLVINSKEVCSPSSSAGSILIENLDELENSDCAGTSTQLSESEECQGWLEAPTKLLISLYMEYNKKVGKTFQFKTKKKMWEVIHTKMEEKGYKYTVVQIQNKWKSLERAYKRKTENNNKTGRHRATCPYDKELQECLSDRSSVFPEYLLNADDSGRTRKQIMEAVGVKENINDNRVLEPSTSSTHDSNNRGNNGVEENCSTPKSTGPVSSLNRGLNPLKKNLASELRQYRLFKETQHDETMDFRKRKLDAYKERTEEIAKKNKLLEQFLQKWS